MTLADAQKIIKDLSLLEEYENQKAFCSLRPKEFEDFGKLWMNGSLEDRTIIVNILSEKSNYLRTNEVGLAILLCETDTEVKSTALKLLDAAESPMAFNAVVDAALNSPDKQVRISAIEALGANAYYIELDEINDKIGEKTIETLLSLKKDPDEEIQQAALIAVSYVVNDDTTKWIKDAFNKQSNEWQAAALWAAGNNLITEWESRVIDGLYSKVTGIRQAAIISAGSMGLEKARERLIEMLDEEEGSDIFEDIIFALSKIGGEDVITIFEAIIANTEDQELIELVNDAIEEVEFNDPEAYLEKYGELFGEDGDSPDFDDED